MPHVDEGTLHALLDGALRSMDPARADAVEAHLEACADCRALAVEAAALRGRAGEILSVLEPGVAPDFGEVLVRAGATGSAAAGPASTRARQLRWTRGLAWAATLVIALGTGYLIRDRLVPARLAAPATMESIETAAPQAEPQTPPQAVEDGAGAGTGADTEAARTQDAPAVAEQTPRQPASTETLDRSSPATLADGGGGTPEAAEAATAPDAAFAETRQEAAAVEQAIGTPLGMVASGDEAGFRGIAASDVEAAAGTPLAVIPGAAVLEVLVGGGEGSPVIVSRQRLGNGVEVRLTQQTAAVALESIIVTGASADSPQAPAPAVASAAGARERLRGRRSPQAQAEPVTALQAPPPALEAEEGAVMNTVRSGGVLGWELVVQGPLGREELEALAAAARDAWIRATLRPSP